MMRRAAVLLSRRLLARQQSAQQFASSSNQICLAARYGPSTTRSLDVTKTVRQCLAEVPVRHFSAGPHGQQDSGATSEAAAEAVAGSNKTAERQAPEKAEQAPAAAPGTEEGPASVDSAQEAPVDWQSEAAALEQAAAARAKEVDELKERLARALADMENLRERTARAQEQSRQFAIQGFVKGLLDVADNLERAIGSAREEDASEERAAQRLESLLQGIEMTHRQLEKAFQANGVTKLEPKVGDKMDPNLHEAVFDIPNPNQEPGTIGVVTKKGFMLNGRVIRPAEVGTIRKA